MRPLYIIPARGGSKGIPRKNVAPLAGRPLIAYTIAAAQADAAITGGYVLLSTDDDEIARVARAEGLEVEYMRPAALATDTAGSREVVLDAMAWARSRGIDFDTVVLLQPTSPLRTAADIAACRSAYEAAGDADMAVTVCEADANPYYTLFETDPDGILHISKGDGLYTRRQDCPKVYQYNGAVYVIRPASIGAMPLGAFPRRVPSVMPASRSIDIDTPMDLHMAEYMITSQPDAL